MNDSVIIQSASPICIIVCLEVQPEWLFIAAEVSPSGVIHCHVRFCTNEVWLRLISIECKHLSNFSIDTVCGVVTNNQVFWIQELSNCEVAPHVGNYVDCLNCSGVVSCPFNVNLYRQPRCSFIGRCYWVQPVNVSTENRWTLGIQP